ncbi:LytR C-terminal domain-containing protein [Brachybacterium sp. EF45031]|uniref:LytR C-terminal domain-containing protein n=1 Tax=Brachybacterium sillae TaxID=2810536 RepID=UPI00217D2A5C|nr:LytR C-terminal domain-containing protein [Brachybacterium sillae]MCS6711436.1 LytR C-terminal domain-containing protein [Brachybacterium sillae]
MADSSYPYPPDQFDREADAASFHGAHRAEEPFWKQNLVYILVIAAAFLTLTVLLFALNGLGGGDREPVEGGSVAPTTQSAPPASEAPSSEAPAAEPDRSVTVSVVNAGGINGLAGRWREQLEDAGWEDVEVATADSRQENPVVLYRDEADRATAQALADEVGAGEAQQSDEYESRITFLATSEPSGEGAGEGEDQGDDQGDEQGDDGEG